MLRQILREQINGLIESSRSLIYVGEIVARAQSIGIIGAQDAESIGETAFIQGDGPIEFTRLPVNTRKSVAGGEGAGVIRPQTAGAVGEGLFEQVDGLSEPLRIPVGVGETGARAQNDLGMIGSQGIAETFHGAGQEQGRLGNPEFHRALENGRDGVSDSGVGEQVLRIVLLGHRPQLVHKVEDLPEPDLPL